MYISDCCRRIRITEPSTIAAPGLKRKNELEPPEPTARELERQESPGIELELDYELDLAGLDSASISSDQERQLLHEPAKVVVPVVEAETVEQRRENVRKFKIPKKAKQPVKRQLASVIVRPPKGNTSTVGCSQRAQVTVSSSHSDQRRHVPSYAERNRRSSPPGRIVRARRSRSPPHVQTWRSKNRAWSPTPSNRPAKTFRGARSERKSPRVDHPKPNRESSYRQRDRPRSERVSAKTRSPVRIKSRHFRSRSPPEATPALKEEIVVDKQPTAVESEATTLNIEGSGSGGNTSVVVPKGAVVNIAINNFAAAAPVPAKKKRSRPGRLRRLQLRLQQSSQQAATEQP